MTIRSLTTITLLIASMSIIFISCAKESALQGTVEVAGSSTVLPITSAIAEEFTKLYAGVDIPIRSTGTGGGFKNFFGPGKTDINNASRAIKDSEKELARSNDITPVEFHVATDAITIIVNIDNPVDDIATEELEAIWSPHVAADNWAQVNSAWPDMPLNLYGPTSASGTFDYFTDVVNGEEGLSRTDYQKTEQDNTIIQAVQGSAGALGYLGLAYYLENSRVVKALRVNGVAPSIETARSGDYAPLARPLFIYVSSKALAKKEVQDFVRFYLEATSTSLISEVGYVPVTDDIAKANLAKLEEEIKKYQ